MIRATDTACAHLWERSSKTSSSRCSPIPLHSTQLRAVPAREADGGPTKAINLFTQLPAHRPVRSVCRSWGQGAGGHHQMLHDGATAVRAKGAT